MSNVESENNDFLPKHVPGLFPEVKPKASSKIANWFLEKKIVSTPAVADKLLTVVALFFLAISVYIFFNGFSLPFQAEAPVSVDVVEI